VKILIHALILAVTALSTVSCGDDTTDTGESTLALTATEAAVLASCLADIEACRATAADGADFRELCGELLSCLPERDRDRASTEEWRTYCRGVEARCADGAVDEATCAELRERCEGAGDRDGSAEPVDAAACMEGCLAAGGGEALCSERCVIL